VCEKHATGQNVPCEKGGRILLYSKQQPATVTLKVPKGKCLTGESKGRYLRVRKWIKKLQVKGGAVEGSFHVFSRVWNSYILGACFYADKRGNGGVAGSDSGGLALGMGGFESMCMH